MRRVVYISRATSEITDQDLNDIIEESRRSNAKIDVTGVLIHHQGRFFQCIEGPHQKVSELLEKIERSSKHDQIDVLLNERITERLFGCWAMASGRYVSAEQNNRFEKFLNLVDLLNGAAARRSAAILARDLLAEDIAVAA
ncbi:MAG: BLUF domain-containing protein [Pseudomonadota bacterium]